MVASHQNSAVQSCILDPLSVGCMTFSQITRERDVRFYTGMQSTAAFKLGFGHLQGKASVMHYWNGEKWQQGLQTLS